MNQSTGEEQLQGCPQRAGQRYDPQAAQLVGVVGWQEGVLVAGKLQQGTRRE